MRQANEISRIKRRRHCFCCGELFELDSRSKGKQRYCSKQECQAKRQGKNEKDWCRNNPDSVAYYKSKWLKKRPDYSRKRRIENLAIAAKNRKDTRIRMEKIRWKAMFDKNKPILTQLVDKNKDSFCLMGGRWLFLRLTRTSRWTKEAILRHTGGNIKRIANCLPKGRLYDLSGVF
jgi:hypothetical protein